MYQDVFFADRTVSSYSCFTIVLYIKNREILTTSFSDSKVNGLLAEICVLAQKVSTRSHMKVFTEQYLTPLNNILRSLKGMKEEALPTLDMFIDNDRLRDCIINDGNQRHLENMLMLQIFHSFVLRNMEKAQLIVDLIEEHITKKNLSLMYVMIDIYVGLTACNSMRYAKRNHTINAPESEVTSRLSQALKTCEQLKLLTAHSKWNFENKHLLLLTECQYAQGKMEKAAESYQASIYSAKLHKFINEQALACELAGYFYKDQGDETIAMDMFKQANQAYMQWGAIGKAKLLRESTGIEDDISTLGAIVTRKNAGIQDVSIPITTVAMQQKTEFESNPIGTSRRDANNN